jgi:hypothetical protein
MIAQSAASHATSAGQLSAAAAAAGPALAAHASPSRSWCDIDGADADER